MLVGERRAPARVIGVRDFAHQRVDVVRVESGAFPGPRELLADVQDANVGVLRRPRRRHADESPGPPASVTTLTVSGRGRSLPGGEQVQDENVIVLYAPPATVSKR